MTRDTQSDNPGREVVALSTEILPVWNIVAVCMMLAASIATMLVFSVDMGRYVPTGSVMGFQGPSYFYITGFWGLIVSVCWGFSTAGKLKRLSLSAREDGALVVKEQVIGGSRELVVPGSDLKAVILKRYPSAGHIAWLFIALGLFAFILQFAVPNLQLPFAGFPVAGTTLLVFDGCMVVTAVIGVARPGLHLAIVDTRATHVIKMPGVISQSAIIARITTVIRDAHLIPSDAGKELNTEERTRPRQFIMHLGAICFIIIGIMNLTLVLAGSSLSVLNQGSSWVLIISGTLAIVSFSNRPNALPANSWILSPDALLWSKPRSSPRLWFIITSITGIIIVWYFVGASVTFDQASIGLISGHTALLGLIGVLYTSWCCFSCSTVSISMHVSLGGQRFMNIRAFSTTICVSKKIPHTEKIHKIGLVIPVISFLVLVSVGFFIIGSLSFH